MSQFIDRRPNGKNKSAVNRHKFIRRFKSQIKKAVADAVSGRSITDLDRGEKVNIPAKDISEPTFHHGPGGRREAVHPGNTDFVTGDRLPRPLGGGGGSGSGKASKQGEGLDDFAFQISREEFLDLFFDDLELPDLVKTQLAKLVKYKKVRAGYTTDGVPANIDVVRSLKGALSRRIALQSPHKSRLREAEQELAQLRQFHNEDDPQVQALLEQIKSIKARLRAVPFIDNFDLRYRNRITQTEPSSQAVMFCLMDVSGSMDQAKKDLAKRFFTLLYFFLTGTYESIDLVFIRHHTVAKEVDENEFFYSRETGGTVVSSALKLMQNIIDERYPPTEWNIYAAQASDGDNWSDDSPLCRELLINRIMPKVQYYAYIEIADDTPRGLWREFLRIKQSCPNFAMQRIAGAADIFPVFRKLFKKKGLQA
ncbi:MAG TPA: YeaH/YhbH family protein [Gammaproteobacteria bacterium]|nr:YeaH/YhbH family protein [Gammaproteobacteria bacterium]